MIPRSLNLVLIVILILCSFLETLSFSNFTWFLRPMSVEYVSGKAFHYGVFEKAHWSVSTKETAFISRNGHMKAIWFPTQSTLIGRRNQAKFENHCVSRNAHRIKIAQPNSMILVSFSSAEDALFNVKNIKILDCRVLKICRSTFFWDTLNIVNNCQFDFKFYLGYMLHSLLKWSMSVSLLMYKLRFKSCSPFLVLKSSNLDTLIFVGILEIERIVKSSSKSFNLNYMYENSTTCRGINSEKILRKVLFFLTPPPHVL